MVTPGCTCGTSEQMLGGSKIDGKNGEKECEEMKRSHEQDEAIHERESSRT